MSPIIIFIIDLWFFLQFAKLAFVIGFLATKYEVETKKIEIGDSSVIWPTVGLLLSSLWVIISFIWPKETLPAMTLVVLSVSSYVTGNFFCLFTSFRPTKQGKIITSLSSVVTVGLLILMTLVMSQIKPINPRVVIDFLFFAGLGISFGLIFYQVVKIASDKAYTIIMNSFAFMAIATILIFVALVIGQIIGYGNIVYVNLTLMAISLTFSGLLSSLIYEISEGYLMSDSASRYSISLGTIACLLIYLLQTLFFNF